MSEGRGANKSGLWLRLLPGIIISGVAIYAIVHLTRGQNLIENLRSVNPSFVLLLIGITLLSLISRSFAWRAILGNKVSLATSFFGVCEGYLLNNIFPLRAGELGRALFVGRASGLGTFHVLSTILIERAFDIFFAASLILLTLPMVVGSDWIQPIAIAAFVIVILGMVMLLVIAINRERISAWIAQRDFRAGFFRNKILPQITKLMDGLSALVNPGQFFLSVFWIALTWFFWILLYFSTISQISPNPPFWWGGFIAGLIALGVAIPSAPASVGVYEATILGAFALLGVTTHAGLAYAIVLHLAQILVTTFFGIWGLIRDGQSLSTLFETVISKKAENHPHKAGEL